MFPNGRHGSQEMSQVHRLYCAGVEIRKFLLTELAGRMREEQDEALHACLVDRGTPRYTSTENERALTRSDITSRWNSSLETSHGFLKDAFKTVAGHGKSSGIRHKVCDCEVVRFRTLRTCKDDEYKFHKTKKGN